MIKLAAEYSRRHFDIAALEKHEVHITDVNFTIYLGELLEEQEGTINVHESVKQFTEQFTTYIRDLVKAYDASCVPGDWVTATVFAGHGPYPWWRLEEGISFGYWGSTSQAGEGKFEQYPYNEMADRFLDELAIMTKEGFPGWRDHSWVVRVEEAA